jgi:membrane associated rhomboid family serine protease
MGIYDRDYNRGDQYGDAPGHHLAIPQSMTVKLVVFTALVYVAQLLSNNWVTRAGELQFDWYRHPWEAYRLITYGFLHSPVDLWHIVLNMFGFWLFGRDVEHKYGPREFLAFYLTAIVVAGIVWTLAELVSPEPSHMVGASGGVSAVLILFAFHFPYRTVLFMFIIPMPMWVLAVIMVVMDAFGAMHRSGDVAFTAHLGGALFAAIYYKSGMRLSRWLPERLRLPRLGPRPKLRVHRDEEEDDRTDERIVDDILRKIQEQGQDSLTPSERRILEEASREYQKKRR